MHRLLWADGRIQEKKTDKTGKTTTTTTKATFAAFKLYLESQNASSGTGKNEAIRKASIQVEFHGTGPDSDAVGAQRPVVVGWAPFVTPEESHETTQEHTQSRSLRLGLQGGATMASAKADATNSSTRTWTKRYFDTNCSQPVTVLGSTGEGSKYNGVKWEMKHNTLAGEGVRPEVILYLLVTRKDDREYAVRITVNVDTARLWGHKEHKCVLRVSPREPDNEDPAVCHLQGEKMLEMLDVDHFEALLSPAMDESLQLPWDVVVAAKVKGAKEGGAADQSGANSGKNPEKDDEEANEEGDEEGDGVEGDGVEGDGVEGDDGNNEDGQVTSTDVDASATVAVAVSLAIEPPGQPARDEAARPPEKREASVRTENKAALLETLIGPFEGGEGNPLDDEDLATKVALLEGRMEVMEYRMAKQALLIRALLKGRML
ncbi:MAG: hypothetical protein STHCBS139747_001061 [Sporothrix thermara]